MSAHTPTNHIVLVDDLIFLHINIYLLFTANGVVVHVCDNVNYEVWGVISFSGHR